MAITATFYSFSKRRNSTAVPTGAGTQYSVALKEPTSMQNPVFTLSAGSFAYNYCQFNGAYYFVEDVTSLRNDIWQISCSKDVLATWKSAILATEAYIMYSNIGNSEIIDTRIPLETSRSIQTASAAFPHFSLAGTFVMTCTGENSTASWWDLNPALIEYSITKGYALQQVIDDGAGQLLPDPTSAYSITEALNYLSAILKNAWATMLGSGKAIEAVRSCTWLPISYGAGSPGGVVSDAVYLSNFPTGITRGRIVDPIQQIGQITLTIPWQATDWRRNEPYTQIYAYIPFIGLIHIPSSQVIGDSGITFIFSLNISTGELAVQVNNSTQVLGTYGASIGVEVPVGSSNAKGAQAITSVIGTGLGAGAAAAAGLMSPLAAGAAALAGIASIGAGAIAGTPQTVGGLGGGAGAGLGSNIVLFTIYHDTTVAPSSVTSVIGLPSFTKATISTRSGYIQCAEFSLNAAAPEPDLIAVNNFMNSGAFIE